MFRLKIVFLGIGAIMAYIGYSEWQLTQVAAEAPQEITCEELAANGPGDNAHVVISDFLLWPSFVYESKEGKSKWDTVWIPATPLDGTAANRLFQDLDAEGNLTGDPPPLEDLKILVKTDKAPNEVALNQIGDRDTLKGLVINEIEEVKGDQLRLLQESFPGVDFNQVWILEHDREPYSKTKALGIVGGGLLLLGAVTMSFFAGGGKNA